MEDKITHLAVLAEGRELLWVCKDRPVTLRFKGEALAEILPSGSGIAVVELGTDASPDNAFIYNGDGTLRVRVKNPKKDNGAIDFGDVYYIGDQLALIISFSSWQMACEIDEAGNVIRTYEVR